MGHKSPFKGDLEGLLNSMKVLLFTDSLGAGGAQRQLVGLAHLLRLRGCDVKVCTYHDCGFFKGVLDADGIENEVIAGAAVHWRRIWTVARYLRRERADWVIAYQETPSLVACMARLLGMKSRLVVSERSVTQRVGWSDRVRFFLYRWSDAIVPNSWAQGEFLCGRYPWMRERVKVIENFVDLDAFRYEAKKKREVAEIAVVATIWEPKNTLGFIDAVRLLVEKGVMFHVSWYGKSEAARDYLEQCERKIKSEGLQEYIVLKDKVKDVGAVYRDCDFLCLPSFYEGTPNVICEAMASGRPVICSDVCDNGRYVVEDENGFLFDPRSAQCIAEAVERAIGVGDKEYERMCGCSRTKAERMLSADEFIKKYMKTL